MCDEDFGAARLKRLEFYEPGAEACLGDPNKCNGNCDSCGEGEQEEDYEEFEEEEDYYPEM